MNEKSLMHHLMVACSDVGARVFRNHVGLAYQGKATKIVKGGEYYLQRGDVVIQQARVMKAGLGTGSSDLIGWRPVTITPEMVGTKIAQFLAIEVKTGDRRPTADQGRFLVAVELDGGLALVANDVDEAVKRLTL